MNNTLIEEFLRAMRNDTVGDGLSVELKNGAVTIIEDALDEPGSNGEYGFGQLEKIERDTWSVIVPLQLEKAETSGDGERFTLRGENRLLEIRPVSFEEAENALAGNERYYLLDSERAFSVENLKRRYQSSAFFCGLSTASDDACGGYVMIIKDYFDHAYQVSWYGIGNMSAIRDEALQLFGSFQIRFDVEAWIADHS